MVQKSPSLAPQPQNAPNDVSVEDNINLNE